MWVTALNAPTAAGRQTGRQALAERPAINKCVTARRRPGTQGQVVARRPAEHPEPATTDRRRAAVEEPGSQAGDIEPQPFVAVVVSAVAVVEDFVVAAAEDSVAAAVVVGGGRTSTSSTTWC